MDLGPQACHCCYVAGEELRRGLLLQPAEDPEQKYGEDQNRSGQMAEASWTRNLGSMRPKWQVRHVRRSERR